MNHQDLLNFLIMVVPSFKSTWESDDNLFIHEDGSFNFGSICSEFSHHFCDQEKHNNSEQFKGNLTENIPDENLFKVFDLFEKRIEENETKDTLKTPEGLLSNAICTCFLENISQTKAGGYAASFMGRKSKKYFDFYHVYDDNITKSLQ